MKFYRMTFTIDDQSTGEKIAAELLERRWIACSQQSAVLSRYHWKGTLEETPEWKFELKTTLAGREKVTDFILQNHPYEVPELLCEEADSLNPAYSLWLEEECAGLNA